ncbi:hypothetical protein [Streptomyces lunaelactis]|uniref:hypothetical protein n=1 Tax=Streptomyces lunaelactis TaxID=1535768 RepID=UPI00158499F3|nr:hypothetical protein [Streptomyces lunaelactis]NUK25671.1 hypothetical protein [Streptomyces lunaelactis]NUK62125.1 hypothetical protein [Streptomyces lunaelactis]
MRQRVVRLTLVAGVAALALLVLLSMCGGGEGGGKAADDRPEKPVRHSAAPPTRLSVPSAYDTGQGWEISNASPEYAIARESGRIAHLERVEESRFRLRTLDAATGRPGWTGAPWHPPADAGRFPRLLAVAKEGREYFVTWSFGTAGEDALNTAGTFVALDVYDAVDGTRQRFEIAWPTAPTVSGTGPGILVSDGGTRSAVVDPVSGEVTEIPPASLGHPKGCRGCRRLTEVRGVTAKGLLLSGDTGFWVRGGWYSANVAPSRTDPASGVPTSVAPGFVLAKWQPAKGSKDAGTYDIWAVHEVTTGKPLVQARCHKPAIEPGEYPQAMLSPEGAYLVAGNLAFDLEQRKAHCFEESDGSKPLTLTTVTDAGTAYGATSARSPADALAGGGDPIELDLATAVPQALSPNVRLPGAEAAGVGIFSWTDAKDRLHLIGYPRREE